MCKEILVGNVAIKLKPGKVLCTNQKLPVTLRDLAAKQGLIEGTDFIYCTTFAEATGLLDKGADKFIIAEELNGFWGKDNKYIDTVVTCVGYRDGCAIVSRLNDFEIVMKGNLA